MHGTPPIRPKELEVKLELDPASLPALYKIPLLRGCETTPKRSSETSVYFDTDKHKLRKKGLMLRVRRKGSCYIQTIKAAGNRDRSSVTNGKPRLPERNRI
jgi:triphosphatase